MIKKMKKDAMANYLLENATPFVMFGLIHQFQWMAIFQLI